MSYANGPKIVTDGLVLCLDAANRKSYPGSGSTWYDLSGQGNHVTAYSSPVFASNNGGVFDFTNTSSRFESGQACSGLHGSAGCTLASWTRLVGSIDASWVILNPHMLHAVANWSTGLLWNSSTLKLRAHIRTSQNSYNPDTTITFSLANMQEWHYYVQVYDPPYIKVYVDGSLFQQVSSQAGGTVSTSYGNFVIGMWKDSTLRLSSDIQIGSTSAYNKALTDNEIAQTYNALKGRFGL